MLKKYPLIIAVIVGILYVFFYWLIGLLSTLAWILFMYSTGLCIPAVIYFLIPKDVKQKSGISLFYYIISCIAIFAFWLANISLNSNWMLFERRLLTLGIVSYLYLIALHLFMKLQVRLIDYLIAILYSTAISAFFVEYTHPSIKFNLYIGIWVACFIYHVLKIVQRNS